MKKVANFGKGKLCPKCNIYTVIRKRLVPPRGKNFFYKQWEYCEKCKSVYFEEKYKSTDWQEHDTQEQHLFDIMKEI